MRFRRLSSIARLLYPHGSTRSVFRGPIRGSRFRVGPSMGFTFAAGYDSYSLGWQREFVTPGATVFDIGANRGQMSLFFARAVGTKGKVFAFEPVPSLFAELETNIALNNFGNVNSHCIALSDHIGCARFQFHEDFSTQGKLSGVESSYEVEGTRTVEVECATLDSFAQRVDSRAKLHLKIDVEGAAASVLKGGREFIATLKPSIFLELHGPDEWASLKILDSLGYQFYDVITGDQVDAINQWVSPVGCVHRDQVPFTETK